MTPNELAQHEAIKKLLKQVVENNPTQQLKTMAKDKINVAVQ